MFKEFRKFIARGNVIDLAVGIIIGGAFSNIVNSLVDDMLMPAIGAISGGLDFTSLSVKIVDAEIKYGNFIQSIINFFIIAFCIFVLVKIANRIMHKKEEEKAKEEPAKTDEVIILEEIRDLLKK